MPWIVKSLVQQGRRIGRQTRSFSTTPPELNGVGARDEVLEWCKTFRFSDWMSYGLLGYVGWEWVALVQYYHRLRIKKDEFEIIQKRHDELQRMLDEVERELLE